MKASLVMLAGRPVRGGEGFFGKPLLIPVDQVGRNEAGLALRGFSVSGLLREGNLRSRLLGGGGLRLRGGRPIKMASITCSP